MDELQPAPDTKEDATRATARRGLPKRLYRLISVGEDIGYRPVAADLGLLLFIVFVFVGACASAIASLLLGSSAAAGVATGLPLAAAAVAQISFGACALRSRAFIQAASNSFLRNALLVLAGAGSLAVVLPILMSAAALVEGIREQLGMPATPEVAHATLLELQKTGWGMQSLVLLVNAGVLVPIAEEIGWRGLLFPSLRRLRFSHIASNVITTALFTAVHLPSITEGAMMQSVVLLSILSLTLGWLRARTGSLAAPIGLHAAFNAVNLMFVSMA